MTLSSSVGWVYEGNQFLEGLPSHESEFHRQDAVYVIIRQGAVEQNLSTCTAC